MGRGILSNWLQSHAFSPRSSRSEHWKIQWRCSYMHENCDHWTYNTGLPIARLRLRTRSLCLKTKPRWHRISYPKIRIREQRLLKLYNSRSQPQDRYILASKVSYAEVSMMALTPLELRFGDSTKKSRSTLISSMSVPKECEIETSENVCRLMNNSE